LWQETRDPGCKTAVNWVTKTIRRETQRKALEGWETNRSNCEVTHQAIWSIANSLMKRDGPNALTAIHGPFGLKFLPLEKPNAIAVWKISSLHMTCVTNTINDGWKIESKFCFKPRTTLLLPPEE
jgi:hypothetical protein